MSEQVGYGPLQRIDGPLPVPPPYGLLQAAASPASGVRIIPDADGDGIERWINGAELYPYPPDLPDVFDACATGSAVTVKGFGSGPIENPQFGAYTVWLAETCKSYKVWNDKEFVARALVAFAATESAGVAREFLTGSRMPLNPYLGDSNAEILNSGAATSAINALALLEGAIARSGKLGLVHMSPVVATTLRERLAIDVRDGVLKTINGNVVIPDAGYVWGATPPGQADATADQEWIYATGPIDVRRSATPEVVPGSAKEALDRGTGGASNDRPNTYTYRVERYYLATFDGEVHAAVLADRCSSEC